MLKSVLIVDDEVLLARTLANALRDAGWQAVTADSAEAAAVLLFPHHRYDVVVLDHRLPGESGVSLLERMRAERDATPAILMTAYETASMRSRALELSVAGFFRKPFDLGELLERLEQIVTGNDARAATPGGRLG
ncbi:MAG: response regulator [Candidatus Eisenbacteria bacterium]